MSANISVPQASHGVGPSVRDRGGWPEHGGRVWQRERWITEAIIAIYHLALSKFLHSLRTRTISFLAFNPQGSTRCLEHSEVVTNVLGTKNEWPCNPLSGWNQNQCQFLLLPQPHVIPTAAIKYYWLTPFKKYLLNHSFFHSRHRTKDQTLQEKLNLL